MNVEICTFFSNIYKMMLIFLICYEPALHSWDERHLPSYMSPMCGSILITNNLFRSLFTIHNSDKMSLVRFFLCKILILYLP